MLMDDWIRMEGRKEGREKCKVVIPLVKVRKEEGRRKGERCKVKDRGGRKGMEERGKTKGKRRRESERGEREEERGKGRGVKGGME